MWCPIHTARQTRQNSAVCVVSGGVNWVVPTSAFCVGVRPAVAPAVPAPPDTLRRWTHLSGRLSSQRHTRHDKTVLSLSCPVWTALNVFRLQAFCRRQSWVVGNPIHTAEADATKTRQFCRACELCPTDTGVVYVSAGGRRGAWTATCKLHATSTCAALPCAPPTQPSELSRLTPGYQLLHEHRTGESTGGLLTLLLLRPCQYTGRQWRHFVPCLCELIFAAIS